MADLKPELILDARVLLGEGPSWHEPTQQLYWVDIEGKAVHVYDPATGTDRRIAVDQMVGCVVPRQSGGVVVAMERGFYGLDLDDRSIHPHSRPGTTICRANRFNDGKCDSQGRLWAGTTKISHDRALRFTLLPRHRSDLPPADHRCLDLEWACLVG
jgi:sugar lactone lactonase YvrE